MRGFKSLALLAGLSMGPAAPAAVPELQLPDGFEAQVYADELPGARSMVRSEAGTLFVGTRNTGAVYALRDEDGDGTAERRWVLARGLTQPNGVALLEGALYIAEISRIWRLPQVEAHLDKPRRELLRGDLPTKTHHGWRYIAFGPDDKLYVSIGAPCNVCELETFERDGRELPFGSITRMDPDGGNWEVFARGIRNSVGLTWDAGGELWFTDNGRDWMGDDLPPGELNHAAEAGQHFGFPQCHGGRVPDPEYGAPGVCEAFRKPAQALGPHVAPLGLKFYHGEQFPAEYRGQVLIAEHGSWNRSEKIGYRITRVRLDENGQGVEYTPFVTGWLDDGRVRGRPVDLLVLPDGSLLISDDAGGRIWRVSYVGR